MDFILSHWQIKTKTLKQCSVTGRSKCNMWQFFSGPTEENLAKYLNAVRHISTSCPNSWQWFEIHILNWSKLSKKILNHRAWYLTTSGCNVKKQGFVIFRETISISFPQKNIFNVIRYSIITSGKNWNNFISNVASIESYWSQTRYSLSPKCHKDFLLSLL